VINQQKFLERWREVLQRHPAPGTDIAIARAHRSPRRVLMIDATTPQPDHDSGSLRLVNCMRVLKSEGHAVTFFADNRAWIEKYTPELQQLGVEVLWHPFMGDPVRWFRDNGSRFDLVFISRHYVASAYIGLVRLHAPQATLVFDTVDLHYLREQREAELANRDDLMHAADVTRTRELALIRSSDVTLVVSPVELELLRREAPGARVEVLSNVHEVFGRRRGHAQREGIVFMGGFAHPPNIDAVLWFVREVFPKVRAQLPDVTFHIVGSKPTEAVLALAALPGVVVEGFVPDIAPFMDGCRLAVAPLRYGAGVKGKVNMSMSYGQPVVATPIAIEGMFAEPGRDVLVAADAAGFAREVVRAYGDAALWTTLSDNGLENVRRHFSFEAARAAVRRLFD
jgi:glycosyltransferase involved in cell wall biosynthesis